MSVRVNLLPEATKQRDRAAQQRSLAALAGVALLAGLGGVYLWQSSQVSQAEELLAIERLETSGLRGDAAELVAFEELADRREQADVTLTTSMASEVSLAGVFQDIAAVMPGDTQIDNVTINITGPPAPDGPSANDYGSFNIVGRTLTSHAPGVERLLLSLEKIVSFRELYLNSSTLTEPDEDIAAFSLDGQIGPEAATDRYREGLPEELR